MIWLSWVGVGWGELEILLGLEIWSGLEFGWIGGLVQLGGRFLDWRLGQLGDLAV